MADQTEITEELIEEFVEQAERAASVVHRCGGVSAISDLVDLLAAGGAVSVSRSLVERHPDLAVRLRGTSDLIHPRVASEAAGAAVGVSVGEALVVETGSVLVSEYDMEDRLVSMLSPILVQVVPAAALLRSLDEVGDWLQARHERPGPSYHALVTGPSRSADIERSLTIGVQGPSELHVAILYPATFPDRAE